MPQLGTDQTIDLLHIDGFHIRGCEKITKPGCKTVKGSDFLFHDINVLKEISAFWKFWEEVRASIRISILLIHTQAGRFAGRSCPTESTIFLSF